MEGMPNREAFFEIVQQIEKHASLILDRERIAQARVKESELLSKKLKEKEIESDLRQVIEATLMRLVIEKQSEELVTVIQTEENKLGLLRDSMTKAFEDMVSEFEVKKAEAVLIFEKLCELEKVEIETRNQESKQLEEKYGELSIKVETFEVKLKEEADKWREESELMSRGLEIMEKSLKEPELKQMESEEKPKHQVVDAETLKRSYIDFEKNDSDAASLTRLAKRQKIEEGEVACVLYGNTEPACKDICEANDGEVKGIVSLTKFNGFNTRDDMSSFAVDQVWALYDSRDDMPRIYAQIREIFSSELSLLVTLLEPVKTTKDDKSIPSACGRFEYGDTDIKRYLMFAHEMKYIKCGEDIIVNPREGETWALFRDWNASWNSYSDVHEPPYRYDFVEVISEFDHRGISVAYMGRVEGFLSVFNRVEHGIIKVAISPDKMQRFSHRVESVKLSGEEEEGVPAGSFELNPAAAPSYHPVVEEGQDGSTKDLPIIID